MAIGENNNHTLQFHESIDVAELFEIIQFFDPKGFYSEFRRNDLSELKPFGSKTVWDKNRSE